MRADRRRQPRASRDHPRRRLREFARPDAVIALAMAVDRTENQPEPARLIGWL
jgi:hypothetical protein